MVLHEFLSTVYSEMLSQITFQSLCIASVIVNCIIFTSKTITDVLVATVFSIWSYIFPIGGVSICAICGSFVSKYWAFVV